MNPYILFNEAIHALRSNLMRSVLTIIGIVVGIFSVTAMLALGAGLSGNIIDRFNSFISGDITVSGDLAPNDISWMREQPNVSGVYGSRNVQNATVIAYGKSYSPSIKAVLGEYTKLTKLTFVSGGPYDFADKNLSDKVAIVDQGFVDTVTKDAGRSVASSTIIINGQTFSIVGVITGGTGGFGRRADGNVLIPYASAIGTLTSSDHFTSAAIKLTDNSFYEISAKRLTEGLNISRGAVKDSTDYFSVSSAQDAINTALETTSMISIFLGIVGGIALFVGGIGTMNMMLTTVTERTKEIGLRKAIGARDSDILLQILFESVALTTIGGAIGILLTFLVSYGANKILTANSISLISIVLSWQVVMYATIVSVVVGIVFGIYPARQASKLQPVDALRAD
jgi:putative ABC transport system permease protein